MPQLVPFYFMNEVVFAFSIIVIVHYVLSKYILPRIINLFLSRLFTVLLKDLDSEIW
jgi:F-type H+-transporting ATPase subunit 8